MRNSVSNSVRMEVPARQMISPFKTTMKFSDYISPTISNLQRPCDTSCLKGKIGFLMISVKNKSFSNRLIELYFDFVDRYLGNGFVTIVDTPYIHNIQARGCDDVTKNMEINKLERIAQENHRRITRLLGKRGVHNIKQISWAELEKQTPRWLIEEVTSAFRKKGKFYYDVIERTREVLPQGTADEINLESFSQFLVEETPILCNQYYLQNDRIVDIYPGENPDFLWKIESGCYSDELPRISEIAQRGSGLVYVDFQFKK